MAADGNGARGRHDERCYCVDCVGDRLSFVQRPGTPVPTTRTLRAVEPEPRHYQRELGPLPQLAPVPSLAPLICALAGACFLLGVLVGISAGWH